MLEGVPLKTFLMARMFLPPGFRFHPTDDELMRYYLKRQVMGKKSAFDAVTELNIYQYSPWDLPGISLLYCSIILMVPVLYFPISLFDTFFPSCNSLV